MCTLQDNPRLPQDLERLIFETATHDWTSKDTSTLLLVAQHVYKWLHPFVHKVFVQLSTGPKFPDFENIPSLKPEDIGNFAKHLLAGKQSEEDVPKLQDLLSSCPNIVNLALWFGEPLSKYFETLWGMHLTRLSATFADLPKHELLTLTFINLSHLELIDSPWFQDHHEQAPDAGKWEQWAVLTSLPKLTHLSVTYWHSDLVPHCLQHCRDLQVLVYKDIDDGTLCDQPEEEFDEEFSEITDVRLVFVLDGILGFSRHNWVNGANGKGDTWVLAELFGTARKNKLLNDCSQRWIDGKIFNWEEELNDTGKKWYSNLIGPLPVPWNRSHKA